MTQKLVLTRRPAQQLTEAIAPLMARHGFDQADIRVITDDIAGRLISIQLRWSDKAWRDAMLMPCIEEATFYHPTSADLFVRALVVLAVRNSLIENAHAYRRTPTVARDLATDQFIAELTQRAIHVLNDCDLNAPTANGTRGLDEFAHLEYDYPLAWAAFGVLSAHSTTWSVAANVGRGTNAQSGLTPYPESVRESKPTRQNNTASVVESGIDPRVAAPLQQQLDAIQEGNLKTAFFDSFKSLTRDHRKLFFVVNHILLHGGTVLTHNYMVMPGRVAWRDPLLKPMHTLKDMRDKLAQCAVGTTSEHRDALARIQGQMQGRY